MFCATDKLFLLAWKMGENEVKREKVWLISRRVKTIPRIKPDDGWNGNDFIIGEPDLALFVLVSSSVSCQHLAHEKAKLATKLVLFMFYRMFPI